MKPTARAVGPLLLLLALQGPAFADGLISREELAQGLADAAAALRSVSVTCDYTIRTWSPRSGLLDPVKQHGVCTFDWAGRCRYDGLGEVRNVNNQIAYKYKVECVFDGKRLKAVETQNNINRYGTVGTRPNVLWPTDPRLYLYHQVAGSEFIPALVADPGSKVVGTVKRRGRRLVVVETKEVTSKNQGRAKDRFLIDVARGFAVVRRSIRVYRPAANDWFDYVREECGGYKEVSPGIWLPSDVHQESYMRSTRTLRPQQIGQLDIRNTNWVLNAAVPKSVFELKFPAGILIQDQQTGKTYQTIDLKAGAVPRQTIRGVEIYKEESAAFFWRGAGRWVGGLALAGVLAFWLLRAARRRRSGLANQAS